jgi:hypothetical protein
MHPQRKEQSRELAAPGIFPVIGIIWQRFNNLQIPCLKLASVTRSRLD